MVWLLDKLEERSMEQIVGQTYDLRNAYKQYGIDAFDRSILSIAVLEPVAGRVQFLCLHAPLFGTIGSVNSFLRISMAMWYIGCEG